MSDATAPTRSLLTADTRTQKRNAAEKRFRAYGVTAIAIAMVALVFLLVSIFSNGAGAFRQTFITLNVELSQAKLDKKGNRDPVELAKVSTFGYAPLIKAAVNATIEQAGIEIDGLKKPDMLISKEAAAQLRYFVLANPDVIGTTQEFEFLASGRVDGYYKGRVSMESPQRTARSTSIRADRVSGTIVIRSLQCSPSTQPVSRSNLSRTEGPSEGKRTCPIRDTPPWPRISPESLSSARSQDLSRS